MGQKRCRSAGLWIAPSPTRRIGPAPRTSRSQAMLPAYTDCQTGIADRIARCSLADVFASLPGVLGRNNHREKTRESTPRARFVLRDRRLLFWFPVFCLGTDPSLPVLSAADYTSRSVEARSENSMAETRFLLNGITARRKRSFSSEFSWPDRYFFSATMFDAGQCDGCAFTLRPIDTGPSTGLTSTLYPSNSTRGKSPCRSFVAASIVTVDD